MEFWIRTLFGCLAVMILLTVVIKADDGSASSPTPIVMWHGMGDTCCFPFSLGSISKMLSANIKDVYVKSIRIGNSVITDYESGFFIHPNVQIEQVCKDLAEDPRLANGYNAIGFSQGGQFFRAVAQRCPSPPMRNLISFGGQHQGVFGLPNCPSLSSKSCDEFRKMLNSAAYTSLMQHHLVQATYWHDPFHEDKYRQHSTFLADINNELTVNQTYIDNLQRLTRLVLVKFANDTIVVPKESQWFEFYGAGQDVNVMPLRESELFLKNRLGLVELLDSGRLVFLESPGNHLRFTNEWFAEHILPILSE